MWPELRNSPSSKANQGITLFQCIRMPCFGAEQLISWLSGRRRGMQVSLFALSQVSPRPWDWPLPSLLFHPHMQIPSSANSLVSRALQCEPPIFYSPSHSDMGFLGSSMVQSLPANAGTEGDMGSITGPGRSPGGGNRNPLLYFCQDNLMDRVIW